MLTSAPQAAGRKIEPGVGDEKQVFFQIHKFKLSFQHAINIKIIFHIPLFQAKISKSDVCFMLEATETNLFQVLNPCVA